MGSAAVMGVKTEKVSLPRVSTVFTAEVIALRLAARLIRSNSIDEKYLVCSDSLSALQEFKNVMTYDHLVHRVQLEFHEMIASGYDVTLTWVPSHVSNKNVDAEARRASLRPPEFITIPSSETGSRRYDDGLKNCGHNSGEEKAEISMS